MDASKDKNRTQRQYYEAIQDLINEQRQKLRHGKVKLLIYEGDDYVS